MTLSATLFFFCQLKCIMYMAILATCGFLFSFMLGFIAQVSLLGIFQPSIGSCPLVCQDLCIEEYSDSSDCDDIEASPDDKRTKKK